jgi:hypothetical protein
MKGNKMIDRAKLDIAASTPNSPEEEALEQEVFKLYNFSNDVEELKTMVGQLWYAFVMREGYMRGFI